MCCRAREGRPALPFYSGDREGPERVSDLPRVTQLAGAGGRVPFPPAESLPLVIPAEHGVIPAPSPKVHVSHLYPVCAAQKGLQGLGSSHFLLLLGLRLLLPCFLLLRINLAWVRFPKEALQGERAVPS